MLNQIQSPLWLNRADRRRDIADAGVRAPGRASFLAGAGAVALASASLAVTPALGQALAPNSAPDTVVQEAVVKGARDLAGVVQKRDSDTVFGIDKPLVDTPRSVTVISDALLSRYDIKTVYDISSIAAGTYTGSYFGVPGSLNIRGTIADNYFNGFLEITNFANYPTPVDASSSIDIVRGPASPVYGAGQISGYLNFIPKSARGEDAKYLTSAEGEVTATYGSYNQREITGEFGTPLHLNGNNSGLYGYAEYINSDSYYIGQHPKEGVVQLNFNTELGPKWNFDATVQYINSSGYLKDIGWNRVTQDLIDNGTYISGHPISSMVAPGVATVTLAQYNATCASSCNQFVLPIYGVYGTYNNYTALDPASIKLVHLSPRVTSVTPYDINNASTPIFQAGLTRDFGGAGSLKLETFSQYLSSDNYQAYGFATVFKTFVNEERITYKTKFDFGDILTIQTALGGNYRYTNAISKADTSSNATSQDIYDLSQPLTPNEVLNDPFLTANYAWQQNVKSLQQQFGLFGMADILMFQHLDLVAGIRGEHYELSSVDRGSDANGVVYRGHDTPVSYNFSLSFKNEFVTPYVTYARSHSLNVDQGDALIPSLIQGDDAVGVSTLSEAGLKTSQFGGRLYADIDGYEQQNEYLDMRSDSVTAQLAQGVEAELRYLITKEWGLTSALTLQHVKQLPFGEGSGPYIVLTPQEAGVSEVEGFGGFYGTEAKYLGLSNGYDLHTTPRTSFSLFATYDKDGRWGLTGGATYNSWTGGTLPGSIRLPAYTLAKLGAYVMVKGVRIDLNVDNLFDTRYFISEYDLDANATVLPGVGREFHIKLSYKFK